ncbi:MAG: HesA/MoeB/ThiF family protein [Muribaculaceae bacterium]|nr:HesA/MoeB/ThiF family protein [Muribaculaceae bacterium]
MNEEQRLRYSRLMAIEEISRHGLEKLRKATALVVGCGALGSMTAIQLAASGVGRLRIVDFDTIDISNLQRQFFYSTAEAGKKKVYSLASRIKELNPEVEVEAVDSIFTSESARPLVTGCDIVVEATDNHSSMLTLDRICEEAGIPCVLAGVSGFSGQVTTCLPGHRRYREVFPEVENPGGQPCSIAGVMGPAAAVAASIEAAEAIKSIVGLSPLLSDKILLFDLLNLSFNILET